MKSEAENVVQLKVDYGGWKQIVHWDLHTVMGRYKRKGFADFVRAACLLR